MSFSVHSIFSYYLYSLPLMHVEISRECLHIYVFYQHSKFFVIFSHSEHHLLPLLKAYPQINLCTPSSKTNTAAITYPSYIYHFFQIITAYISVPSSPCIASPYLLNLTSCKQHTSIISFFSSSQTYPPFPL